MKFKYEKGNWHEVLIGNDTTEVKSPENIKFKYVLSEPNSSNVKNYLMPETTFKGMKIEEGSTYELSPQRKIEKFN
jgi:hypothetical protein